MHQHFALIGAIIYDKQFIVLVPGRVSQLCLALLPEDAVKLVEDITMAPRWTSFRDESVKEHTVG